MAKNREAALKRAREKARLEKREAKQLKREARRAADSDEDQVDEQVLWERFARLSERHEAGEINSQQFEESRTKILEALGIESD